LTQPSAGGVTYRHAHEGPPHIGGFIRREIVEPLGLSVTDAAEALGVTRQALNNLLNEKSALSAEMALRIEKAFGPKMDHLLRMRWNTTWRWPANGERNKGQAHKAGRLTAAPAICAWPDGACCIAPVLIGRTRQYPAAYRIGS
jgi:addiction module HigA family antidote